MSTETSAALRKLADSNFHGTRTHHAWRRVGPIAVVSAVTAFSFVFVQTPAGAVMPAPCGNGVASAADTTATCAYAYTGSEDTFAVPAGVTNVHVAAVGGSGGGWSYYTFGSSGATLNSRGASVSSDLTVTPGATLYVEVAGNGASTSYPYGTTFGDGGFNGGGAGGRAVGACSYGCREIPSYSGAGGGGASDVRTSPRSAGLTTDSRLLVAAGGGGAASESGTGDYFGYAGGGGDAGSAGADGFYHSATGGAAGTVSAGGTGGTGAGDFYGPNGTDGVLGAGGAGAGTCCADNGFYGAGGGGGGYYGGGGGGSHTTPGGGGGGSSYSSGSNTAIGLTTYGAQPSITISYDIPSDQSPGISSADNTTFTVGSDGSFTVTTTAGLPTATTVTETGDLPTGVSFTDNGDGTATLAGTPTAIGAFPITITASNGQTTDATQSFLLTVAPAPLTVTVQPSTRLYGQPDPAFVLTYNGLVNGDSAAAVTASLHPVFTAKLRNGTVSSPTSPVGVYTVRVSGRTKALPNYAVTFVPGKLTVTNNPHVTAVSPANGPTTGGTRITITGSQFTTGDTVVIGQYNGTSTPVVAATDVVIVSSTEITATTGANAKPGTFIVFVVTNTGTHSPSSDKVQFTYTKPTG